MSDRTELAGTVLEAMSQDSGPASCEPFTGWCVDLARELLDAERELEQLREALGQFAEKGLLADMNPTRLIPRSQDAQDLDGFWIRYLARAEQSVKSRARAALAGGER